MIFNLPEFIHGILSLFFLYSALYMCASETAIKSVIALIFCFLGVALTLFFFHVEFLGVSYLIVYVGAIAILFLFVIMITPIKNTNLINDISSKYISKTFRYGNNYLFYFFFITLIFFFVVLFPEFIFENMHLSLFKYNLNILNSIEELSSMAFLAQSLFNFYSFYVLISGIILLIALIGTIVLTFFNFFF
jgi:NADH:ubiquinone oxidoreductase subunit 6 (subunit J)